MKNIIRFIIFFWFASICSINVYTQARIENDSITQRFDYSPFASTLDEVQYAARYANPLHEYETPITYYDYMYVETMIQTFLGNVLELTQFSEPQYNSGKIFDVINTKYFKPGFGDSNQPYLYTKCTIFKNKAGHDIVSKYEIFGNYMYILDFYTQFWSSNIHFTTKDKTSIAYSYALMDKVTLKLDLLKQFGSISKNNSTIKNISEYEVYLDNKIKERKRKN